MNTAIKLLQDLEQLEVQHPHYVSLLEHLQTRLMLAKNGMKTKVEWVIGPSRVGKSMLINALARANAAVRVNGILQMPLVVAKVPEQVSPQHLPGSVLLGMGLPVPSGNVGAVRQRMLAQLKRAGTKAVLFEEASHIVDTGTKVPPRAAGDFFKTLSDEGFAVILFGVPRLSRLRDNEQLRLRSAVPRVFAPYDSRIPEDRASFAACLNAYLQIFKQAGWPFGLGLQEMFEQCYLLTGGLIGVLSAFMQSLAEHRLNDMPRTLSWADCKAAADEVEGAGDKRWPAFKDRLVGASQLMYAHAQVLETNLMPIRDIGAAEQQGAQ